MWARGGEQTDLRWLPCGPEHAPDNAMPAAMLRSIIPADLTGSAVNPAQEATKLFIRVARPTILFFGTSRSGASVPPLGSIKFEDATAASGIQFTHSFGAEKLGSLLESTGGGCVWFDYNNDGQPDLYVVSGKPLEGGIHPYPLQEAARRCSA